MNSNRGRTLCETSSNLYNSEHKLIHHTLSDYGGLLALKALIKIQNADDIRQHPKPQCKKCSPQPQNPNTQTQKAVAFQTVAFCPWHSDQIPKLNTDGS